MFHRKRFSESRIAIASEHIPLDAIVQDWFWWKTEGDPIFNENFTDVPGGTQAPA